MLQTSSAPLQPFFQHAVTPCGFPLKGNHSSVSFRHLLVPEQLRKWWQAICCLRRKRASLLCLRFGDVGQRLESPKKRKEKKKQQLGPSNYLTNSKLVMQQKLLLMLRKATKRRSWWRPESLSDELGPPCGIKARGYFGKHAYLFVFLIRWENRDRCHICPVSYSYNQ